MKRWKLTLAMAKALCAVSAVTQAQLNITYIEPERFTDLGQTQWERAAAQRQLTEHIEALAKRYVPQGQMLEIEVTDVDLAGRQNVSFSRPQLRVIKPIDWPSITLRYTVENGGGCAASTNGAFGRYGL
jgi:hypothetical protein